MSNDIPHKPIAFTTNTVPHTVGSKMVIDNRGRLRDH